MTFREWLVWIFVDRCSPSRRGIRLGREFVKTFNRAVQNTTAVLKGFAEGMGELGKTLETVKKEGKDNG